MRGRSSATQSKNTTSPPWKRSAGRGKHGVLAAASPCGVPEGHLSSAGSYHPVDSSKWRFKTAAQVAYKASMPDASPGPAGAHRRAEGHHSRQLHGRHHRRP